ncbi:MAG: A/G-specific adenine glycosylase [Ruminococcaceae bacterium]|nr:A/G-specific adenine glycosylase [Oscillospiraceae bacterium]
MILSLSPSVFPPLLSWYRKNRRPLPWRENKDPYRIWLSEIMLQQTRIEAVIPYYHRFLAEAPTIQALSELSDERLMKLWEGLGYYSRARNLKKAAQTVMNEHGGKMPRSFAELRSLSGIGDYTAGAISSIAFGLPEPAVDGNVLRVLMRLCGREDDVAAASTKKAVTEALRTVYPSGQEAGDLTEALMELGEHVCIPAGVPKCEQCPWQAVCLAHREHRETELPKKSPKKEKRKEELTVLLLFCDGKIGLQKRPENGLLAGLWEFPNLPGRLSAKEATDLLVQRGISVKEVFPSIRASHIFTHVVWEMSGLTVLCDQPNDSLFWFTPKELTAKIALPTAFRAYRKEALTILKNQQ